MAVRIKVNAAAVRELLRSAETQADLKNRAERIARTAGPGFEVESFVGRNRARSTVRSVTDDAKLHPERLKSAIPAGK